MNAIDYLLDEHRRHRSQLDTVAGDPKQFKSLRSEIIHHVNVEESILYPNLLKIRELENTIREVWEEHNLVMQLIQELDGLSRQDKAWLPKFNTLKKLLLTHMEDEEEKLFPQVSKIASQEFLCEVGEQMEIQKKAMPTENIIYPEVPGSHHLN